MSDKKKCVNLQACIEWVHNVAGEELFYHWLNRDEDTFIASCHPGLGTWIRNNLELWYDGPPVKYFNDIGIYHADDMSGIILTSLWRKYHKVDIDLDGQVKEYRDHWEEYDPKVNKGER